MDFINIIGFLAAAGTTIAFIPQVIRSVKTKSTKDISFAMYSLFCIGISLWIIYGIFLNSYPIILANSITLILAITVLITKLQYG